MSEQRMGPIPSIGAGTARPARARPSFRGLAVLAVLCAGVVGLGLVSPIAGVLALCALCLALRALNLEFPR